jgi:hypothetical protein
MPLFRVKISIVKPTMTPRVTTLSKSHWVEWHLVLITLSIMTPTRTTLSKMHLVEWHSASEWHIWTTQRKMTLSNSILTIWHCLDCSAECHYANCCYAECRYAECRCTPLSLSNYVHLCRLSPVLLRGIYKTCYDYLTIFLNDRERWLQLET